MIEIDWSKKITPQMLVAKHAQSVRANRDSELEKSGWLLERHRDELGIGIATTLSAENYAELLLYRHRLRDWPAQPDWPNIDMPMAPEWLATHIKS